MKRFIIVILLLTLMCSVNVEKPKSTSCLQMDVLILADFSGSVDGYESFVINAITAFITKFDLSESGLKMGVITFESTAVLVSPLTSNTNDIVDGMAKWLPKRISGSTNMYDALGIAVKEFNTNGRQSYKKLIIVISDGEPDHAEKVMDFANLIKVININICGVLILAEHNNPLYMQSLANDYCYVESSYENLIDELKKLNICL